MSYQLFTNVCFGKLSWVPPQEILLQFFVRFGGFFSDIYHLKTISERLNYPRCRQRYHFCEEGKHDKKTTLLYTKYIATAQLTELLKIEILEYDLAIKILAKN